LSDLPTGTVTFLFTDIEGSTRLLEEHGSRYVDLLEDHRRVIRDACTRHGGVEVDTQGDAFFVAFGRAADALATAEEAQRNLELPVRMGIHTGEPQLVNGGYVGIDVHRGARICAAGHGGQVVVSETTQRLLHGVMLRDLGEHRLKDLGEPLCLYQLGEEAFPPLRSLRRTNLPVPATPFLGRDRELADVVELVRRDDVRLLTLAGAGGTGKTRLALQAAAEVAERFPDGIWWVPLAPLRDPQAILPAVARTLELQAVEGTPLAATISAALRAGKTLLLLDNLEQLLPLGVEEVAALLSESGPVVLVTSRERLQLAAEQVYPVPTLGRRDAVELFEARARTLDPAFEVTAAVDDLCERLDDLPLAIELAAARTPLFTPEQLLDRLSKRLDLLKSGRGVEPRQQTLRATIEWSYALLAGEERRVFRGLSVFAGGCTFEAAEEVCGADPDTLQSLLDKSLVRRRQTEAEPRYWMLQTILEYGFEQLCREHEDYDVRRRHAEWVARLADGFADAMAKRAHHVDFERLDPEYANIDAALAFAAAHDVDLLAAIAGQTILWFTSRGRHADIDRWVRPALERDLGPRSRARALTAALSVALSRTDTDEMELFGTELRRLAQTLQDQRLECAATYALGAAAFERGEIEPGRALFENTIAQAREASPARVAGYLGTLGWRLRGAGLLEEARPLLDEAVGLARRQDAQSLALALAQRANLALDETEFSYALELYREALTTARQRKERRVTAICLNGISAALAGLGRAEDAVCLAHAGDRLGQEMTLWSEGENDVDDWARELRRQVGDDRYVALASEGRALSEEAAIEHALRA